MNSFLDKTGLTYFWGKIKDAVSVKADKIQEVNHGTSDTTFTLTPNVMHIWGTVSSLNLSLPTDSNSTLDEYLFTFTCPTGGTTLTLPASIVWIQEPEFEEGKTYQVSIVNGLAGFLTNNMVAGGGSAPGTETDPIFKASPAYGIAASDITNWNNKEVAIFTINYNGSTWDFTSAMYTQMETALSNGKLVYVRYIQTQSNNRLIVFWVYQTWPTIANKLYAYHLHGSNTNNTIAIDRLTLNSDGSVQVDEATGNLVSDSDVTNWNSKISSSELSSALNNYLSLAGGTMANTNLVTNLNADLLDGYNATEISRLGWVTTQNAGTGTSECSWFEIETPSSTGSLYSYEIITKRSSSTHPNIEHYKLDIFRYSSTSVSVSLINDGANYLYGNLYKVCVAVSTDSKVYIQHGSTGASSQRMYIRSTYGAGSISDTAVGSSTYGTASGFTAAGTVEITGYIRVDGSSVSYSGSTRFLTPATSVLNSVTVYSGSTAPSSSTGNDGDIYIQTS